MCQYTLVKHAYGQQAYPQCEQREEAEKKGLGLFCGCSVNRERYIRPASPGLTNPAEVLYVFFTILFSAHIHLLNHTTSADRYKSSKLDQNAICVYQGNPCRDWTQMEPIDIWLPCLAAVENQLTGREEDITISTSKILSKNSKPSFPWPTTTPKRIKPYHTLPSTVNTSCVSTFSSSTLAVTPSQRSWWRRRSFHSHTTG